jgi:hypothetical protein
MVLAGHTGAEEVSPGGLPNWHERPFTQRPQGIDAMQILFSRRLLAMV